MAGPTRGWKGVMSVHSWIVIKGENDQSWRRYDVAGWGNPVRLNWWPPDRGSASTAVVLDIKRRARAGADPRIEAAIKAYRYANAGDYRIWPGPNSNTFIAAVLCGAEAQRHHAAEAVARDYRPWPYAGSPTAAPASRQTYGACSASSSAGSKASSSTCSARRRARLRHPAVKVPATAGFGLDHSATAAQRPLPPAFLEIEP